ncbi:MAG TPA: hypothetical protein VM938_15710 [Acidimicrobiales bacterium]|nr:hypothetical protein [Acidimicrobiales bacterium]
MSDEGRARLLAAFLAAAGVTHFLVPRTYDAIVPAALPGSPRAWTIGSGVAELACAAAVAHRRTRRVGALAAFVLFVAVFPANVKMAIDWQDEAWPRRVGSLLRLPLQVPLLIWAWRVARAGRRPEDAEESRRFPARFGRNFGSGGGGGGGRPG